MTHLRWTVFEIPVVQKTACHVLAEQNGDTVIYQIQIFEIDAGPIVPQTIKPKHLKQSAFCDVTIVNVTISK